MRRLPLILITLLSPVLGFAQQRLTLDAAIAEALRHNPALESAREAADMATARHRQAKAARLPQVDLSEMFNRTDNPAEAFALLLNQERFSFEDFVQGNPNDPEALDTWMTRLEVTQPVFTGGKLSARIDQAGLMATADELGWRRARDQVVFDAASGFANLAKAREHLELITKARATTQAHVELAEHYAEQGLIVDAEVLRARVHLAEMDELLTRATSGARLAEAALNFHLGANQSLARELAPLPPPPPVAGELEEWLAAAVERRPDLLAAGRRLEAGRLEEKVARSAFLPEVAVLGRVDLYDDAVFGDNGSSSTLMAVAKINLFRGGSDRAAIAASRHQTNSHEHDIERFEEAVRLEVQQAWQDMATAHSRHAAASSSVQAAAEALRVREQRFKQGLDRMIDLLDAETALLEAEVRELVARYDIALASYQLYFAAGQSRVSAPGAPPEDSQ